MKRVDFNKVPPNEQKHFYQCQKCREMVDMRQLDEVLFHENHQSRPDIQYGGSTRLERVNSKFYPDSSA